MRELLKLAAAAIFYKISGCGYKTKTHKNTKLSTPKSDAKKLASMASAMKRLRERDTYMPLIQDKLNQPAINNIDRIMGRHQEKKMHIPNKYDGVRSRLKNLFNSLPGGD